MEKQNSKRRYELGPVKMVSQICRLIWEKRKALKPSATTSSSPKVPNQQKLPSEVKINEE